MLDIFKARLKAKAKALGVNLSQKRIDAFADRLHKKNPDITDEADHDARIEELHELQPLDEVAKADDYARTLETKAKAQSQKKQDDDPPSNDDPKDDDQVPKWAQKLMSEIDGLKKSQTTTSIREKLVAKLKDKEGKDLVPATFYKGRTLPEKEEYLDSFVEELRADWDSFRQEQINAGFMSETAPRGGGALSGPAPTGKEDAEITAWAEKSKPAAAK